MSNIPDDLDDEPAQKQSAGIEGAVTKTSVSAPTDDLDCEFGDENVMTKSDGLDKIIPADKKTVVRVALLADKSILPAKKAWVHYIAKKGWFHCNTLRDPKGVVIGKPATCCKETRGDSEAEAQLIVASLAVKYNNADPTSGKYTKDANGNMPDVKFEIGWLKLSRSGYRRVSKMTGEDEKVTDFDITVQASAQTKGFEYARMQTKYGTLWQAVPELKEAVLEAVKPFLDGVLLTSKLGKKISDLEWKALFHGKAASSAGSANVADLDSL